MVKEKFSFPYKPLRPQEISEIIKVSQHPQQIA